MKRTFVLFLAIAVAVVSYGEDKIVEATGVSSSYRGAVNEALVSAVEMVFGVTVSADERAQANSNESSTSSSRDGDVDLSTVNDSIARQMKKDASGRVRSYDVVSKEFDPVAKKHTVTLSVSFYAPPGLHPDNRRRMAVVPFRPANGDTISWYGQKESSAEWVRILSAKLNERLTQTRKFTMVDRQFDAEVNAELARLSGPNASKADAVRLNQKLGTDYLVVGDAKFFPVASPGVNPLTGQALPVTSQKFAEVSYRVLLAPTGQLKWADTVTVDAIEFAASDVGSFVSATAEAVATQIADAMMSNILPFEIVGRTQSGQVIIGEGGKSLAEGERLNVFVLGEEVRDTRTGEVLDQIEDAVGTVEVVRVTEKMSYAKVVEGDGEKMQVGARLRRPKVQGQPAQPAPPLTTTIKGNGTGGIVAPF